MVSPKKGFGKLVLKKTPMDQQAAGVLFKQALGQIMQGGIQKGQLFIQCFFSGALAMKGLGLSQAGRELEVFVQGLG